VSQTDVSETIRRILANEQLKKHIKVFLGIACLVILLGGGLIVWAGVATFRHVATIGENANVQEQVQSLKKTGVLTLPAIPKVGCWQKAQSMLVLQIWIEKPIGENVQGLKDACFGSEVKSSAK
jgi:hypothetical protein